MTKTNYLHVRNIDHGELEKLAKKCKKTNPLVANVSDFIRYLINKFKEENK